MQYVGSATALSHALLTSESDKSEALAQEAADLDRRKAFMQKATGAAAAVLAVGFLAMLFKVRKKK